MLTLIASLYTLATFLLWGSFAKAVRVNTAPKKNAILETLLLYCCSGCRAEYVHQFGTAAISVNWARAWTHHSGKQLTCLTGCVEGVVGASHSWFLRASYKQLSYIPHRKDSILFRCFLFVVWQYLYCPIIFGVEIVWKWSWKLPSLYSILEIAYSFNYRGVFLVSVSFGGGCVSSAPPLEICSIHIFIMIGLMSLGVLRKEACNNHTEIIYPCRSHSTLLSGVCWHSVSRNIHFPTKFMV